jgi:hypothetical protein
LQTFDKFRLAGQSIARGHTLLVDHLTDAFDDDVDQRNTRYGLDAHGGLPGGKSSGRDSGFSKAFLPLRVAGSRTDLTTAARAAGQLSDI